MGLDADTFVKSQRQRYKDGAFALNFGGTTHNIVYTPGLATALLNQKSSYADFEHVGSEMMWNVFGFPRKGKGEVVSMQSRMCRLGTSSYSPSRIWAGW